MSDPKLPSLGDIWVRTFSKTKAAMESGGGTARDVKLAPGDKVTPGAMLIRKKDPGSSSQAPVSALDAAIQIHKAHMENPDSITPASQHELMAALLKARGESSGVKA